MTSTPLPFGSEHFGFDTDQVHAGEQIGDGHGARVTPIYLTAGFVFDSFDHARDRFAGHDGAWTYSRVGNPTNVVVEDRLTALEHGVGSLLVGSGQAALTVAMLAILKSGDHFLATQSLYEGTKTLFRENFVRFGIEVEFVDDPHDLAEWQRRLRPTTRAVFAESIPNPKNDLIDFDLVAGFARDAGVPFIVDSTAATPYLLRPLDHGASVVVHSASKFLSGHGASLAGVIVDGGSFDWARYPQKFPQFSAPLAGDESDSMVSRFGPRAFIEYARTVIAARLGPVLSPVNAFLLLQGLETLSLRVERHSRNALAVAEWLEQQPEVESVDYPGLASSPHRALAERYLPRGAGSVFGFTLTGGLDDARTLIDSVELFSRMTHMGDVRSMILHPGTTSHAQVSAADRARFGIDDGLVRLSVGIEDEADLIADLDRAFVALRTARVLADVG
ncbi:O-acetylhomoserine aminocarboxypropyltransferase/cysteine synthase family protein [Glaciihabitans sp. INWT7]|uniref:O-acetylhomoserine aminocarboxypropyltransferase/cysteine synthase family protein n=1 Tax=Glaciihabitans sp. INWT7 TaxID=2596912 RepID=UPI002101E6AA|nr:PLP-dependent transferase [Glaciihabitans sp. INWT7]